MLINENHERSVKKTGSTEQNKDNNWNYIFFLENNRKYERKKNKFQLVKRLDMAWCAQGSQHATDKII